MDQKQKRAKIMAKDTSLSDLPNQILPYIFSRLPAKSILACRPLCKSFHFVTTNEEYFSSLHSCKSEPHLLIQFQDNSFLSPTLSLIDPEQDLAHGFGSLVHIAPKFNLPTTHIENGYTIVNSCNGFLCLKEKSSDNPRVVSNPMIGEYVILPEVVKDTITMGSGLGFCSETKIFKVLRIFRERKSTSVYRGEICSVGSGSWRAIEKNVPFCPSRESCPVFLNGALHWIRDDTSMIYVDVFDFGSELFGEIKAPYKFGNSHSKRKENMTVGILGDYLSLCDVPRRGRFEIWRMKEYGFRQSWSKDFAFKITAPRGSLRGLKCVPIRCLHNGELVLISEDNIIICYDQEKDITRFLKFRGVHTQFQAVVHTPSFFPFKYVMGNKVDVLNIRPWLAQQVPGGIQDSPLVEYYWSSSVQKRELPKHFFQNISVANIIREWETFGASSSGSSRHQKT